MHLRTVVPALTDPETRLRSRSLSRPFAASECSPGCDQATTRSATVTTDGLGLQGSGVPADRLI
jgi:hypothetical protein